MLRPRSPGTSLRPSPGSASCVPRTRTSKRVMGNGIMEWIYIERGSLFSVDIYTCKKFNLEDATDFTKSYFQIDHVEAKDF